jgi:hypothetical protein
VSSASHEQMCRNCFTWMLMESRRCSNASRSISLNPCHSLRSYLCVCPFSHVIGARSRQRWSSVIWRSRITLIDRWPVYCSSSVSVSQTQFCKVTGVRQGSEYVDSSQRVFTLLDAGNFVTKWLIDLLILVILLVCLSDHDGKIDFTEFVVSIAVFSSKCSPIDR